MTDFKFRIAPSTIIPPPKLEQRSHLLELLNNPYWKRVVRDLQASHNLVSGLTKFQAGSSEGGDSLLEEKR